ncbi:MAG: SOS response-associated peptidase [Desulfobacterales bacterium]|jgi:putative SOS response-associated peptidase YedK
MCGRFVGYRKLEELEEFFPIDRSNCEVAANYNVAPSQQVLAIFNHQGENWLEKFHWGLVPFWAKDPDIGNRMINARSETVAEKPAFKNAFKKRRCLIVADGFYEWKGPRGQKQPMFITVPDKKPLAFAGLWETWNRQDQQNDTYRSCTIITVAACEALRDIHHRMPAILKPELYELWLDPQNEDVERLKDILEKGLIKDLVSYPVSKQVNSTRKNDPSCIQPVK